MSGRRLPFIDWMRGIGVVIMIEAHVFDAWMRVADRALTRFTYARILGGWAAPTFLFLAGLSLTMAMGRREARGVPAREITRMGLRNAWRVLGYAFLVRTPSALAGGGLRGLLKVDVLNIMGLAMLATAGLWRLGRRPWVRAGLLVGLAAVIALLAPFLRLAAWPVGLPDVLEPYIRPVPGRTSFSLFPWPGFVLAGGAAGLALAGLAGADQTRRLMTWFGVGGLAAGGLGYACALLPSPYPDSQFWTTSPSFFLLRCGVMFAGLAGCWLATPLLSGAWAGLGRVLARLGNSSFLVYWLHVEIVYGFICKPLRGRFSFEETIAVWAAVVVLMYGAVVLRDWVLARWSWAWWPASPARVPSGTDAVSD